MSVFKIISKKPAVIFLVFYVNKNYVHVFCLFCVIVKLLDKSHDACKGDPVVCDSASVELQLILG